MRFEGYEWRNVSGAAKELVRGMLRSEPRDRLRLDAVLQHPWLQHAQPASDAPYPTSTTAAVARALEPSRSVSSGRYSSGSFSGELLTPAPAPLIERFAPSERAKLDADLRQQVHSTWDAFQQATEQGFKLSVRFKWIDGLLRVPYLLYGMSTRVQHSYRTLYLLYCILRCRELTTRCSRSAGS